MISLKNLFLLFNLTIAVASFGSKSGMADTVVEAYRFARQVHENQKYGDRPYTYHLLATVDVLRRFGFTKERHVIAGLLHDSVEDNIAVTKELIAQRFGVAIADIVDAVSYQRGLSEEEKYEASFLKISKNLDALIIKLADRIANVEASRWAQFQGKPGKIERYLNLWPRFKAALWKADQPFVVQEMWRHLELLLTDEHYARGALPSEYQKQFDCPHQLL